MFYRCPIPGACRPGVNGSRTLCAAGYTGVLCSVCDIGYFEQFGVCALCPATHGESVAALVGLTLVLLVLGVAVYMVRKFLPVDMLKLGLSMLQIIASGSSVYSVPWPPLFQQFISSLRVCLVDGISLTKANCTHTLTFYDRMVIVFVALKVALVLLLGVPLLWKRLCGSSRFDVVNCIRARSINARLSALEESLRQQGRRRSSATRAMQARLTALHSDWAEVDWVKVFKSSFMLLFVAYPGVALSVMRAFHCVEVNGRSYLVADMRLECYVSTWAGYGNVESGVAGVRTVGSDYLSRCP